jgi:hypothetical protein
MSTLALKSTFRAEKTFTIFKAKGYEPKQMLHRLGLICENCDRPTDRCEKKQGCGVCSACEMSKKTCTCSKCTTCKNSTADCDCVCATCEISVKDCVCHSAYCAWCGRDPCYCDAEYQEYLSSTDNCIDCGRYYTLCTCGASCDDDHGHAEHKDTACSICDNYHTGRKCPQEMTREDDA